MTLRVVSALCCKNSVVSSGIGVHMGPIRGTHILGMFAGEENQTSSYICRCIRIIYLSLDTASIAQLVERPLSEREVVGSNPAAAPYQRCKKWY